jgi:hypothetical protein
VKVVLKNKKTLPLVEPWQQQQKYFFYSLFTFLFSTCPSKKNRIMKTLVLLIFISTTIGLNAQSVTSSAPLSYTGKTGLIIENKVFTSSTNGVTISLSNCSGFKIRNCFFKNTPGSVSIHLSNCSDIQIQGCSFDSVKSGVYAINCTGKLVIQCNAFKDIIGPKPRGQMVQFNTCTGAGNRIVNNILEQTSGVGNPEDLINLYASSGTTGDPIRITGNKTRGGGPSPSGGGFMLGDNGSHDIVADNNILVNPGQYGIAAPSGKNITISNNTVFGVQQSFTNVGLYVGLQSEVNAGYACIGNTISLTGNKVNWKNKNNAQNDIYICPCCPNVIQTGNTVRANISASILPTVLKLDNTCANLNLNCSVLGGACPSVVTEIESEENAVIEAINIQIHNKILAATSNEKANWKLLDVNGKIYFEQENKETIEVEMSTFQNGMYLLKTISKTGKKTHKFIHSNN